MWNNSSLMTPWHICILRTMWVLSIKLFFIVSLHLELKLRTSAKIKLHKFSTSVFLKGCIAMNKNEINHPFMTTFNRIIRSRTNRSIQMPVMSDNLHVLKCSNSHFYKEWMHWYYLFKLLLWTVERFPYMNYGRTWNCCNIFIWFNNIKC